MLLDIMMPIMNGYEACKKLKAEESTRDIPIVIITAAVASLAAELLIIVLQILSGRGLAPAREVSALTAWPCCCLHLSKSGPVLSEPIASAKASSSHLSFSNSKARKISPVTGRNM